jgi:6-phosphogluconate dehydrogenase
MNHQVGFIGLGRMGQHMVLRLLEQGISVVGFNRTKTVTDKFVVHSSPFTEKTSKFTPTYDLGEFLHQVKSPRIIFLMLPNGSPIDEVLDQLISFGLQKGDIVIDGGNTLYIDTVRRSAELAKKGIHLIDCGTSGGLSGARNGACLMLGGEEKIVKQLTWVWQALAVKDGFVYMGPSGAGHYVKMIHNGIEYGMDEAIGEGFELLYRGPYVLDLKKVADVYAHGSVIRSWLIDLLSNALNEDPKLDQFSGRVGGGETGTWAVTEAKKLHIETPVIEKSLVARKQSLTKPSFSGKVVSALRAGYGGHKEPDKKG